MAHHHEATVQQFDFTYTRQPRQRSQMAQQGLMAKPITAAARRTACLCVICGRVPAHLTIKLTSMDPQQRPAGLCLRCHFAVMQQRRVVRAQLDEHQPAHKRLAADDGLIVPRSSAFKRDRKYKYQLLTTSRRLAQKALRCALDTR